MTTASIVSKSHLELAVLPPATASLEYHEYLKAETIQSRKLSQLNAFQLHSERSTRQNHSRLVSHHDKAIKSGTFGVSERYPAFPIIRATFIHRWSCCLCSLAIRIGPVIAPKRIGGRKAQAPKSYGRTGFGMLFSLDMAKRCRRKIDIAVCVVQEAAQSQLSMRLHCAIECPRIVPRSSEVMQLTLEGSTDAVKHLLGTGQATARDVTIHGTTLLHLASKISDLHLMRLLIQEGGDVNAQNEDGDTPLHWAMNRGANYETTRLLIENGADLANHTLDGRTPLHTYFNDTVEKVLLRDDWIEETPPNSEGMSIAHFVAWSSKSTSRLFRRSLTYTSTDIWHADGFGRTCLHFAASRGNINILEYLLERSSVSEVRRKDCEGRTALHYAARNKRLKTIDLLLAAGGDLHARDNLSRTVLHEAARWGNMEVAQKIVALGKSTSLISPDKHGQIPSLLVSGRVIPALALRRFLTDIESTEASLKTISKGYSPLDHIPSPGLLSKVSISIAALKSIWVRAIIFAIVSAASGYVSMYISFYMYLSLCIVFYIF